MTAAVQKHVVGGMVPQIATERAEEPVLTSHDGDELDLGAGQVDRRGQDLEPVGLRGVHNMIGHGEAVDEDLVRAACQRDARFQALCLHSPADPGRQPGR